MFKPTCTFSMSIEVIARNFQAGKLDAAAMWEPHARRVVERGFANYAATGAVWKETDADFTLMRQDFIEKNPEAAVGWLKAEIEAIRFMIDNPRETAAIIAKEVGVIRRRWPGPRFMSATRHRSAVTLSTMSVRSFSTRTYET